MARIAGIDLPRDKRIETALTYIFGIGPSLAKEIIEKSEIQDNPRTRDLSEADAARLREIVEADYRVEGDLKREVQQDIKRKMEIGCYQGLRHRKGLPVHGQRTQTNARTRKGPKKTVAGKKKVRK